MQEKKRRNKKINYGVDIHIRLKDETFSKIQKMSGRRLMTYSEVIRYLIDYALDDLNFE